MATAEARGYRKDLVDPAAGRISREIFVNEEIYREELDRLFARAWLFVGHGSSCEARIVPPPALRVPMQFSPCCNTLEVWIFRNCGT